MLKSKCIAVVSMSVKLVLWTCLSRENSSHAVCFACYPWP